MAFLDGTDLGAVLGRVREQCTSQFVSARPSKFRVALPSPSFISADPIHANPDAFACPHRHDKLLYPSMAKTP